MNLPFTLPTRAAIWSFWAAARGFVLLALVAALVVQTVRIEGFAFWPFKFEGLAAKVERLQGDLDRAKAAQALAEKAQRAVLQRAAEDYEQLAKEKDIEARSEMQIALGDADRHIAANSVRVETIGCPSGGTFASAQGDSARDIEGAGQSTVLDATAYRPGLKSLVAVLADDVRICTENTIKAEAAHDWARGLEAASK